MHIDNSQVFKVHICNHCFSIYIATSVFDLHIAKISFLSDDYFKK